MYVFVRFDLLSSDFLSSNIFRSLFLFFSEIKRNQINWMQTISTILETIAYSPLNDRA